MSDDIVETGLVAAAVTETQPEPAVAAAVELVVAPKITMPDGWDLHRVAALITDVAQNMYDLPYLLKKHALTPDQYAYLEQNVYFKRALEAEILTWQSANSIQKRLALESAIAVEAALPTVAARLSKATEPLSDVVALLKVLSEIAGTIGSKAQGPQASAERFKIVINMGSDVVEREATPSNVAIQSQPAGAGTHPALSALVETK